MIFCERGSSKSSCGTNGAFVSESMADAFSFILLRTNIAVFRALETLFHNIQNHQDVPIQERCPNLRIAAEHDDDDTDEDDSMEEPVGALPGAWPE